MLQVQNYAAIMEPSAAAVWLTHCEAPHWSQLLPGDGPGGAIQWLQDEGLRPRVRRAAPGGIAECQVSVDWDRLNRCSAPIFREGRWLHVAIAPRHGMAGML